MKWIVPKILKINEFDTVSIEAIAERSQNSSVHHESSRYFPSRVDQGLECMVPIRVLSSIDTSVTDLLGWGRLYRSPVLTLSILHQYHPNWRNIDHQFNDSCTGVGNGVDGQGCFLRSLSFRFGFRMSVWLFIVFSFFGAILEFCTSSV